MTGHLLPRRHLHQKPCATPVKRTQCPLPGLSCPGASASAGWDAGPRFPSAPEPVRRRPSRGPQRRVRVGGSRADGPADADRRQASDMPLPRGRGAAPPIPARDRGLDETDGSTASAWGLAAACLPPASARNPEACLPQRWRLWTTRIYQALLGALLLCRLQTRHIIS